MDEKFIKLTVRDDATSKLQQLARLREENLKHMTKHSPHLSNIVDEKVQKEFRKLRINTKVDLLEEPLTMLSLLKEAQLKVNATRFDYSFGKNFDPSILKYLNTEGPKIRRKDMMNVERQVNEYFDVKVKKKVH